MNSIAANPECHWAEPLPSSLLSEHPSAATGLFPLVSSTREPPGPQL